MKRLRALWASLTAREIVQDEAREYHEAFLKAKKEAKALEENRNLWRELHAFERARYQKAATELHALRQELRSLRDSMRGVAA